MDSNRGYNSLGSRDEVRPSEDEALSEQPQLLNIHLTHAQWNFIRNKADRNGIYDEAIFSVDNSP